MKKLVCTEVFTVTENKILLGKRKKKGFGQGKWLGLGGKVEAGETIEQAMIRECEEEGNIKVKKFIERGVLSFYYKNDSDIEVHFLRFWNMWANHPNQKRWK